MPNIKTAISIDKPLFEEVEELAAALQVSRSRVFTLAAADFVQRHKTRKLLDAINAAHDTPPDAQERKLIRGMKSRQRRLLARP